MSGVGDLLGDILGAWIGAFLFLTGEVLRKLFTLGNHRVRWWAVQDGNVTWPMTLLGLVFWVAVGALIAYLFF